MTKALRIDSHHHFWQLNRGDYGWLSPKLSKIYQDFLPEDLSPVLKKCHIDKTILIQAAPTIEETQFILGIAERYDFIAGIVGWIDFENHTQSLTTLKQWLDNPLFLGIRPVIQDIVDIDWMLRPEFDPIYQWLIDNDRSFDALVKPQHLDNLLTLCRRYPNLRMVIDHGAKPDIANEKYALWAEKMSALSEYPQLYCKLSGLVTEAGNTLNYEHLEPYMRHLYACFGGDRLMWGSDWPVCTLASSYSQWVELSNRFLKTLPDSDRTKIEGQTAAMFYKLTI